MTVPAIRLFRHQRNGGIFGTLAKFAASAATGWAVGALLFAAWLGWRYTRLVRP